MLAPLTKIAAHILKRRRFLKMSQRQVARLAGCSQSYLAQVETGRRTVSRRIAQKLEAILQTRPGSFTRAVFRRGRPSLTAETRRTLRRIRRAAGDSPWMPRPLGVPHYPRPDLVHGLKDPLWPCGAEAAQDVRRLEAQRWSEPRFWLKLNSIRFDSRSEKRLQVKLGLTGAQIAGVSLGSVGCRLPSLDGQTGQDTRRRAYPAYVIQDGELSIALFPQRCVGTARTHRWPDNLIIAARRGRRITAAVEVDGAKYHSDQENERWRDRELGIPVLHLDSQDVGRPDSVQRICQWIRAILTRC